VVLAGALILTLTSGLLLLSGSLAAGASAGGGGGGALGAGTSGTSSAYAATKVVKTGTASPATTGGKQAAKQTAQAAPKVIVIDAGHESSGIFSKEPIGPGSRTRKYKVSGGTSGPYKPHAEYAVNLLVAKQLQKALKAEGFKVYMVRTKNAVKIANSKRALYANKKKADLFIRLHCDGCASSIHGFLTLTPANRGWTKKIYKKSYQASKVISGYICKQMKLHDRGIVKRSDLTGFNYARVPSVLFEMGNMKNRSDDRRLTSATWQKKLAETMAKGVSRYFS
jgi:N-acetylmuramoyl-L-alanine amidase